MGLVESGATSNSRKTPEKEGFFLYDVYAYNERAVREAVLNAVCHRNYQLCKSIAVTELPDRLVVANAGAFLPGSLDAVLKPQTRPRHYPNAALAEAMVELKMIDTIGSGIWRMFMNQRKRYMPMPDYELADEEVAVTIPGRIFDPKYTQLLIRRSDISLADIIQLDRLQKGIRLDKATVADLRRNGLVEGRYPNVFPAGEVAAAGGKTAEYVDARGFDDDFYARKILQFICRKGSAARSEIDVWISKHLSSTLSSEQKRNKIGNLLSYAMKSKYGWITNAGGPRRSSWILTAAGIKECRRTNPKCKRKCPGGGATEM